MSDKFPIPVSGQKIPNGWFTRLVRFMNSLVLKSDPQFLLVNHTDAGTTISLAPALINALSRASAAPASGGGALTGFPDYSQAESININQTYNALVNGWVIGSVGFSSDSNPVTTWDGGALVLSKQGMVGDVAIDLGGYINSNPTITTYSAQITIPIPAGFSFRVRVDNPDNRWHYALIFYPSL